MLILFEKDGYEILLQELQEIKKILESSKKEQALNEYVNTVEAAKLLKVTTRTLQTYRDRQMISYSQIGNKILFRVSDLHEFLMSHHIKRRVQP